jgi:hypothetical protein
MTETSQREVYLRPEYAQIYPTLPPGQWLRSADWAAAIVTRAQEARLQGRYQRTFDTRHFKFRGGPGPRPPESSHLRTRAEDR